ncbi:hypothetical protein ACFO26_05010 [Lactococcus nasutitermitis]|uniref:DUF3188 domain-containing protein n=1 Tax=Lactococcus nasutitermitis TaxID=1652957 RepID=A0ABV9JBX5_9LACT|nr:hypothetical protein [Lactococcus nasutitermitis]
MKKSQNKMSPLAELMIGVCFLLAFLLSFVGTGHVRIGTTGLFGIASIVFIGASCVHFYQKKRNSK